MAAQVYGGRWEIQAQLPEGGQAHTFRVIDLQSDRQVPYALKRLKNVKRLERFRTEVESLRSLDHPNVIKLIAFDLEVARPYLVSEFCSGGDLEANRDILHYDDLTNDYLPALRLFAKICAGVVASMPVASQKSDMHAAQKQLSCRSGCGSSNHPV